MKLFGETGEKMMQKNRDQQNSNKGRTRLFWMLFATDVTITSPTARGFRSARPQDLSGRLQYYVSSPRSYTVSG